MRLSTLLTRLSPFLLMLALVAACGGPPPTEYVIITSTPNGLESPTPTVTPIVTVIIITATTDPALPTQTQTIEQPTDQPEATSTETLLNPDDLIPTTTFSQIQVAEQTFEHGRMFWLEPIDQIWVMVENPNDKRSGVWMVYDDEFEEGDIEVDPKLVPPDGLFQPERGFGKLWRENPEVKDGLGWAKEGEIGHVSNYQYQPAGEVVDGKFVPAPGYHVLTSGFGNKTFRFNEINGTWQQLRDSE
ncbi:MAG TPA: hypothetical protein VHL11_23230 [Phototrophicaceae bacterium]|jgi:hypothetical protein|nr:hypothetical protein [Phototrophicaceae bacterium]